MQNIFNYVIMIQLIFRGKMFKMFIFKCDPVKFLLFTLFISIFIMYS